MRHLDGG